WAKLFGTGESGLRALSALFGTLTVPVAYAIARDVASRKAGLIAAALVAASPWMIWYSQEARAYALVALLVAIGVWLFLRALPKQSLVGYDAPAERFLALVAIALVGIGVVLLIIRADRATRSSVRALAVVGAGAVALPIALAGAGFDYVVARNIIMAWVPAAV